jgi:hypothetical protein
MQNFAVERPQSIKRLGKKNASLFERAFLFRIRPRFHYLKSGGIIALNHLVERCLCPSSTHTQSHKGGIHSDTSEPRRKP